MYSINEKSNNLIRNSIFITGSARSGTTIMGKLIGSCNKVEYSYEPATLFQLFGELNSDNEKLIQRLINHYLYEDIYMGLVSGRAINLRRSDDSSIYNILSDADVEKRLVNNLRKTDLLDIDRRLTFKCPNFVDKLHEIENIIPGSNIIVMIRSPLETINSLIAKKWFTTKALKSLDFFFPSRIINGINTPHFVDKGDVEFWCEANEIERCIYYYKTQTILGKNNYCLVSYEAFVTDPGKCFSILKEKFTLKDGRMTSNILTAVEPQRSTSKNIPKGLSKNEIRSLYDLYNESLEKCINK